MPACPSCGAELASETRFCPEWCGSAFAKATADRVPLSTSSEDTETRLSPAVSQHSSSSSWRPRSGSHSGWLSTTAVVDEGCFGPGAILAGRYCVVGPLGRGGMGEVYRSDDLRLGQPVVLKFLPESIASDPTRLAQFH